MIPALRDVSLIILLTPCLLCMLVPLAALGGSVWLAHKGTRALPGAFKTVDKQVKRTTDVVNKAGDRLAAPFIAAESRTARWQAQWRHIRRQFLKE
jgi:hypothetical protein